MMGLAGIKTAIKTFARNSMFFVKRNAPQIMVAGGIVAGGVTTGLACKATLKTQDILDEKDKMLEHAGTETQEKEIKKETRKKLVKTWMPVGTAGAASVALILGGHHILGRRAAAALGAAYRAQMELFKQDKTLTELFGPEVAERIKHGLPLDKLDMSEKLKKLDTEEKEKPKTELEKTEDDIFTTVEFLFCEETCGARFYGGGLWTPDPKTNLSRVLGILNTMRDRLRLDGHLTINDIFKDGFGRRMEGRGVRGDLGWVDDEVLGHDTVDFGLGELENMGSDEARRFMMGDNPNILFRFKVRKIPIINYIDQINERRETALKRKAALGGYSPAWKR